MCKKTMNQYLLQKDEQHLSLKNQVEGNPVKKVSKTLLQKDNLHTVSYSWNEIAGLSWIFSENEGEEF